MNTKKGMSQILVLIVAAAVLMMVGLLLITLSGETLGGFGESTKTAACGSQIDSTCRTQGTIDNVPATCRGVNSENIEGLSGNANDGYQVQCP